MLGTRSAILAPLKNLGLIIVDEEQDNSFRQIENSSYNSRDCAIKLAFDRQALVLLGSATPSIESYYNCKLGKYNLAQLKHRYGDARLASSRIIDLNNEPKVSGSYYFSQQLYTELQANLQQKKQSIIFLNRRGFAPLVICKNCQSALQCPNCNIALTWHKVNHILLCHHCNFSLTTNIQCQNCTNKSFNFVGLGTQQIEQTLKRFFPEANILRLDSDSLTSLKKLQLAISIIKEGKADIIIGTQIISKGHDFPNISLVCVLLADMSLNLKHYRSSENTFQLIAQVAGRAGRQKDIPGKVLIQTYNPSSPVLQYAAKQKFANFYEYEISKRKLLEQAPFFKFILIQISSSVELASQRGAVEVAKTLKRQIDISKITILGPTEAMFYKFNKKFFWEVIMQSKSQKLLRLQAIKFRKSIKPKNYKWKIIVDP